MTNWHLNKHFTWKKVRVVLLAIVLIGAAIAAVSPYRFWVLPAELKEHEAQGVQDLEALDAARIEVAEDTYDFGISREREKLLEVQLAIDICRANGDCPTATMLRLMRQEQTIISKVEKLEKKQERLTQKIQSPQS